MPIPWCFQVDGNNLQDSTGPLGNLDTSFIYPLSICTLGAEITQVEPLGAPLGGCPDLPFSEFCMAKCLNSKTSIIVCQTSRKSNPFEKQTCVGMCWQPISHLCINQYGSTAVEIPLDDFGSRLPLPLPAFPSFPAAETRLSLEFSNLSTDLRGQDGKKTLVALHERFWHKETGENLRRESFNQTRISFVVNHSISSLIYIH